MSEASVLELIDQNTHDRQLGILGERTVNVLQLNLALDRAPVQGDGGSGSVAPIQAPDERVLGMTTHDGPFLTFFFLILIIAAWYVGKLFTTVYGGETGKDNPYIRSGRVVHLSPSPCEQ